jgi:hypothetical protein
MGAPRGRRENDLNVYVKNVLARLAASLAVLAVPAVLHAAPAVNMFISPNPIALGGTATLFLTLYDDTGAAFTGGSLALAYPPGVVNVGGAWFQNCGASVNAPAGVSSFNATNISVPASSNCQIYVDITSSVAGSHVIDAPPGSFTSASPPGSSVGDVTATLDVTAPITVTTTADSGAGSLRNAIASANASCASGLQIRFSLGTGGPFTIQPSTPLPPITCAGLVVDGFSQAGASANTQVGPTGDNANLQLILNGTGCTTCNGFTIAANNVTIKGFAIHSFQAAGIEVGASGASITGNYIGTDPGGTTAFANATGVHVSSGYAFIGGLSPQFHTLITGNVIGIHSQSGAIVSNTQVGGRRDGGLGIGNSGRGIFFNASNYTTNSVTSSRVLGNGGAGISVDAGTTIRTVIDKTTSFANGGIGIDLNDDGATANDEGGPPYDTDSGPDRLMNYPVVTSVGFDGFTTTVNGYVKSEPFSRVDISLFSNSSLTAKTQGETLLVTFSGTLDANGFLAFTRSFSGSVTNVSAQMTADTCGDGCTFSSEFSPSVAQAAAMSCTVFAEIQATGDGLVSGSPVIVPPGGAVTLMPLCFTSPTTFAWSTSETTFTIDVTGPAAGATATYTVNVSDGSASGTFSLTLQGALAGTPMCTISSSPALPITPTVGNPFSLTANCSPAATGFTWSPIYTGGATDYVSGQGTATANFQVGPTVEPGVGYHMLVTPTNAAGAGPTSSQIIWMGQVAMTAASTMDFGTIAAGTQSAPQSVTFKNLSSNNSAYFMNVAVSGPYAVTNNCPNPLPPLASCTIDIRFAPTVAGGPQTGTATASYSFPDNPSLAISLTGNATGAPGVMFTPSSLTFAPRTVSTTSTAQTITLANSGTSTLGITSITISGDFAFTTGCPATLAPGASCTIDVTFTPLVVGARTGALTVSDSASGSPHTVALNGTGLSTAAAVLDVSPSVVDFTAQPVDTDSQAQQVIVTNSGNAPLSFGSIGISGEFRMVAAPEGATPLSCPVTLAPGASCRIDIVFHPTGFNLREGLLTLASDGGNVSVHLAGTGLVPEPAQLEVPASLDFGSQAVGTRSAGKPLALHNVSPFPASVGELTASGDFAVSDTCTNIAAGATCSPLVTFQPRGVGPREGLLTIRTLRDVDPYLVRLAGTGIENLEPALELSVTHIGFGNAFVGQVIDREVTLRNVGQAVLQVFSILATGDYYTDGACVGPLAPGSQCTVRITFAPSSPGGRGGAVEIRSNAADSPHVVGFTGTGCFLPSPSRARFGGLLCGS